MGWGVLWREGLCCGVLLVERVCGGGYLHVGGETGLGDWRGGLDLQLEAAALARHLHREETGMVRAGPTLTTWEKGGGT